MVRNGHSVMSISKMATEQYYIWYKMAMVQNTYGTNWFLAMVRNCNFVVRNGKLWYEMVMVQNTYGTKLQFYGTKW